MASRVTKFKYREVSQEFDYPHVQIINNQKHGGNRILVQPPYCIQFHQVNQCTKLLKTCPYSVYNPLFKICFCAFGSQAVLYCF